MAASLALLAAALGVRAEMEIITLRHRTADQVIPVLKPLLESGGALTGMNDQLVIRASRANILQLRKMLVAIDIAARRLMISVRQDSGGGSEQRGAGMAGGRAVSPNEQGAVHGGVGARVFDSRSANESRLEQRIQALEGTPAYMEIGQSIPVTNRTFTQGPGGSVVSDSLVYRDATIGFDVVPRIAGDRVVLEVSPRRDTPAAGGVINLQRMASTASGRLGEWFELGGASQDESREGTGSVAGTRAMRQDVRRVWVKVEEIR